VLEKEITVVEQELQSKNLLKIWVRLTEECRVRHQTIKSSSFNSIFKNLWRNNLISKCSKRLLGYKVLQHINYSVVVLLEMFSWFNKRILPIIML
jgi:hypothetical protein